MVPAADLDREAESFAATLARGATGALRAAKRLVREGWNDSLETQLERETREIVEAATLERRARRDHGVRGASRAELPGRLSDVSGLRFVLELQGAGCFVAVDLALPPSFSRPKRISSASARLISCWMSRAIGRAPNVGS